MKSHTQVEPCHSEKGQSTRYWFDRSWTRSVMPQIIWTRYFLENQGYGVHKTKIYQDNQSAMLMEKNGKASTSKRTRHINICYFFVADRVQNNEVTIEYCPTGDMTGDFFTKPVQGTPFKKFWNEILNCEWISYDMKLQVESHITGVCWEKTIRTSAILTVRGSYEMKDGQIHRAPPNNGKNS